MPNKELIAEVAKFEIPAALASAKMKKESETPKTRSSEPSPRTKEPSQNRGGGGQVLRRGGGEFR